MTALNITKDNIADFEKVIDAEVIDNIKDNMYAMAKELPSAEQINITELIKDKMTNKIPIVSPIQSKEDTMYKLFSEKFNFVPHIYPILKNMCDQLEMPYEEAVDNFNRTNISKIAKYKNPALLRLSYEYNFHEMKESQIDILNAYLTLENVPKMMELKPWMDTYGKNANETDFATIVEKCYVLDEINPDITTEELIFQIANKHGMKECQLMEETYDYSFEDNIVEIKGKDDKVKLGNLTAYILLDNDYRNFTVGYDTHCCQHYDGAGESCVYMATSHPDSGIFVIENDKKDILGQAFIWVDKEKDTFVFDNIVFANNRKVGQFNDILYHFCKNLPYKNIHMGLDYNAMKTIGDSVLPKERAKMPRMDETIYTDYNSACVLKREDEMLFEVKNPRNIPNIVNINDKEVEIDVNKSLDELINDLKNIQDDKLKNDIDEILEK